MSSNFAHPPPGMAPQVSDDVAMGRGRSRAATTIVQWAGFVGLFALVFELTCRIEDRIRFGTALLSPITSQLDLLVRDEDGIHGRPNARYQKWVMNALGTRGPEASLLKPAGFIRIVAVGASETFGLSESPDREFPRQLEDRLNRGVSTSACRPAHPSRFEILNAALPGMSLPTIEQDVRNRVRRFDADVIVVYPTPAQYLADDPPEAARPDTSSRASDLPESRALYPRSLGRLKNQAKALLPETASTWLRRRDTEKYVRHKPPGWQFSGIPRDRLEQYDRDLRRLIGTIRSIGAVPIVATHVNAFMQPGYTDRHLLVAWERFYPRASGPIIVAFDSLARHLTLNIASDSNVAAVDLLPQLAGSREPFFSDFSHFTDYGAARVADTLAVVVASIAKQPCESA